jgi:hypothetical protein
VLGFASFAGSYANRAAEKPAARCGIFRVGAENRQSSIGNRDRCSAKPRSSESADP